LPIDEEKEKKRNSNYFPFSFSRYFMSKLPVLYKSSHVKTLLSST